ncbi:DUF21 domain-containing protein [Methanolobus chelungpuianus]|uniref:Mg2+ and Co2+ transporter CorB n=1 Tax=Methanolobus chelungpuianus TaxID=502115 RepID=A0AAE3H814_9EURY|nr:CNNM domain-containing protein [Methanolobus chelungpuianus]MCQ6961786.1 Mg2+ and Co2+ transporter CorB [Methanolobus chelungpuianus]
MISILWLFILLCLIQSAIFSGLTIGLFGLAPLRLEIEAESRNPYALKVIEFRRDPNFLLATLLWGNVGTNVLLAMLTDRVMVGTLAFVMSTVLIACFGELAPQAYFSRNALKLGAHLSPLVKIYSILLYPVAKPSAIVLDWWLGKEKVEYFKERAFRTMIMKHMSSASSDIDRCEGIGALNFLSIDDLDIKKEGSIIHPLSIIQLPFEGDLPIFPKVGSTTGDDLVQQVAASGKKWTIIVNEMNVPKIAIDSDAFLRGALRVDRDFNPYRYCHHPIVVTDPLEKIGSVINRLKVYPIDSEDDVIDQDLILYWNKDDPEKRIITGSDILGRLLRGIVVRVE